MRTFASTTLSVLLMTCAFAACSSDGSSGAPLPGADAGKDGSSAHGHDDDDASVDASVSDGAASTKDAGSLTPCESFCRALGPICMAQVPQPYASYDTCLSTCQTYKPGTAGDTSGDTLACRIYFMNAAKTDAIVHCPHTAADSSTCK